jgi:hypothetical protein
MIRENRAVRSDFATTVPIANKSLCEDCVPNVNAAKSSGSSPGDKTLTSDSKQTSTMGSIGQRDNRNRVGARDSMIVDLLTQEEASAVLHKSPRVLRFWRTAGIGPAYVKLGKTVLYDRNDLISYVRSNTVQPSVRAAIEEEYRVAH